MCIRDSTPTISQASLLPGMASMACPSRVLSASCAFSDTGIDVYKRQDLRYVVCAKLIPLA